MRCICSYFGGPSVHQTVRLATINTRPDQLLFFWRRCNVGFGDPPQPVDRLSNSATLDAPWHKDWGQRGEKESGVGEEGGYSGIY